MFFGTHSLADAHLFASETSMRSIPERLIPKRRAPTQRVLPPSESRLHAYPQISCSIVHPKPDGMRLAAAATERRRRCFRLPDIPTDALVIDWTKPCNSTGGFADVFTGRHLSKGRVALKRLRLGGSDVESQRIAVSLGTSSFTDS